MEPREEHLDSNPRRFAPFGIALREARTACGMSQDQLSSRSNVSRRTLIRWESGEVSPWIPELLSVLAVLNLPAPQKQALLHLLGTHRSRSVQDPSRQAPLHEFLKVARARAAKTTAQVASEVGCHQTTIVRWEGGALRPDRRQLDSLVAALGVTRQELDELAFTLAEELESTPAFEEHLRGLMWPWDPAGYRCFDARFLNLLWCLKDGDERERLRWEMRARIGYAWMLSTSNRPAEALDQARQAVELWQSQPKAAISDFVAATLLMARANGGGSSSRGLKRALNLLEGLKGKALNWELLSWRYDTQSECLMAHNNPIGALQLNAKALEAASHCGNRRKTMVAFNRARILCRKGDFDEALRKVPAFSEVTPLNDALEYLLLAEIHRSLGNRDLAVHWQDRAEKGANRFGLDFVLAQPFSPWGLPLPPL